MGCGGPLKDIIRAEPNLKHWRLQFRSIGIEDNEILQLYNLYAHAKEQHIIGKLEVLTVFKMLEIERLKFMFKTFAAFRQDKNEEIFSDFRDFVFSLWNFCTMNAGDMAKFAFDLYDTRRSGKVDVDTLCGMLKDLYGYEYRNSEVAKTAATNLQNIKKSKIDKGVFISTLEKTPRLFNKILRSQNNVRRKAIDLEFWQHMAEIRYKLPEGKLIKVFLEVNPEYCAQKVDGEISKSRTIMSARIAPTGDSDENTNASENDRPKTGILGMRLFKKPIGESRIAKRKAVNHSRANAIQRALALDQIKREQRQAAKAAQRARTEMSSSGSISSDSKKQEPSPSNPPVPDRPSVPAPPAAGMVQRHNSAFEPLQTHVEGRNESSDLSVSASEDRQRKQSSSIQSNSKPSVSVRSTLDKSRRWSAPVEHDAGQDPMNEDDAHGPGDRDDNDDDEAEQAEDDEHAEQEHENDANGRAESKVSDTCDKPERLNISI